MTHEEIYAALMRDRGHVENIANFEISKLKRRKKFHNTTLNITHPISKNKWRVKIRFHGQKSSIGVYCKWTTKLGWRAGMIVFNSNKPNNYAIQIYNSHFFNRYYERFVLPNLGAKDLKRIVDLYFQRNSSTTTLCESDNEKHQKVEEDSCFNDLSADTTYLFSADGVGLGSVSTDKCQIMNTFYSDDVMNAPLLNAFKEYKEYKSI